MSGFRVVLTAVFLSAFFSLATAQTNLNNRAGASTVTQPPAPSNIAIIDSGMFADDKAGITRVSNALKQVEIAFTGTNTELQKMTERLRAMRADIEKKQATESAASLSQLSEQANQLQLQIKRKTEDAQANYQKQVATVSAPLQTDISNALAAYAQAHGILMIIDVSRIPLVYANESIDITKDFIADYNRSHPATATSAPARP